jgi:hypothetical protein
MIEKLKVVEQEFIPEFSTFQNYILLHLFIQFFHLTII